jgi:hypothetical protein
MARSDPEIALRKIDIVNWKTAVAQQFNIHSIPQVNVYDRSGVSSARTRRRFRKSEKLRRAGEVEQLTG